MQVANHHGICFPTAFNHNVGKPHVNNNNGVNDPTITTQPFGDLKFFSTERMKAIIRETLYGKIYELWLTL